MTTYVDRVREYYLTYLPRASTELSDPAAHFQELADRISHRVEQVETRLQAEAATPGQDYLERMGTLHAVRAQALELALDELLYSIPPEADQTPATSARDAGLLVMRQEEQAIQDRLEIPNGSREAQEWDRRYPHLLEELAWLQTEHGDLTTEEKRQQLAAILDRQEQARSRRG